MGSDPTIIYLRKPVDVKLPTRSWSVFDNQDLPYLSVNPEMFRPFRVDSGVVGFCGQIHPFIKITWTVGIERHDNYFYDFDLFDDWAKTNLSPKRYTKISEVRISRFSRRRKFVLDQIREFFATSMKKEWQKYFDEHPLFIAYNSYRSTTLHYNDELKSVEFFKVFDAPTAFQMLAMYMANQAIPQKDMPKVPDKLNAESHGFDKYSFRKDKADPARKSK